MNKDWKALIGFIKDARTCLDQALREVELRSMQKRYGVHLVLGAIGAADAATKFVYHMIEGCALAEAQRAGDDYDTGDPPPSDPPPAGPDPKAN